MAITKVQDATNTGTGSSLTVTLGSAATAGNLLVAWFCGDAYASGAPSGFTRPTDGAYEGWMGAYVYYKVAAGGETSVVFPMGSAANCAAGVVEFSGTDSSPFDDCNSAGANNVGGTTRATTSVTGSGAYGSLIVGVVAWHRWPGYAAFTSAPSWSNGFTGVHYAASPVTSDSSVGAGGALAWKEVAAGAGGVTTTLTAPGGTFMSDQADFGLAFDVAYVVAANVWTWTLTATVG